MAPVAAPTCVRFSRFELQPQERRLLCEGQAVSLRPLAFDVLAVLAGRAGRLVTKEELLQSVWGKVVVEENTLQAHVSALRKVLGPGAVTTVPGRGYRFMLEVATVQPQEQFAFVASKHNLPQVLTSFIGREREIGEVLEALRSARLLTLTGAGGCGKTRLALQVADASRSVNVDGVWLVELASLADPAMLPQAVIRALAIHTEPGRDPTESLLDWLHTRHLLLVLDNAEHLLDACARLADRVLRRCAGVQILATSRERLNIDGEHTYRVPSLSLPLAATAGEVLDCEAARLFIERARLQRRGFEVSPRDAEALAAICHRLDGIALAIELAAPCVSVMSLQVLNLRLRDHLDVLTGSSRSAMPRHRTLRALVDWSHELLSADEKAVLRRASVFAGGWALDAAECVCDGEGIAPEDLLGLLTSLVDKSLVNADVQGEDTRFSLLETVRHYAQERLRASGEEEQVRNRHAAWLLALARELDAAREADTPPLLRRLDAEHANLRVALAWCESAPERALDGLLMAALLASFWDLRCHYGECRTWLDRLLAAAPSEPQAAAHAKAWQTLGTMRYFMGDDADAVTAYERAITLWRQLGDVRRLGHTLCGLADRRLGFGTERSAVRIAEIMSIADTSQDRLLRMKALYAQTELAMIEKRYRDAHDLLEQSLPIGREIGASYVHAAMLNRLGLLRNLLGDFEGSQAAWAQCVELFEMFGAREALYYMHINLTIASQELGDLGAARSYVWQSLRHQRDGDRSHIAWVDCFACLSKDLASPELAARFWGCVARLREEKGILRPMTVRHDRLREAARRALNDDAAFDRAWAEGRAWTLEEAMWQARLLEDRLRQAR